MKSRVIKLISNILNKGMRLERENRRFCSSKGSAGYFIILSIIGILVGIWMLLQGFGGKPITPGIAIILGVFVVIKEILDIFH